MFERSESAWERRIALYIQIQINKILKKWAGLA